MTTETIRTLVLNLHNAIFFAWMGGIDCTCCVYRLHQCPRGVGLCIDSALKKEQCSASLLTKSFDGAVSHLLKNMSVRSLHRMVSCVQLNKSLIDVKLLQRRPSSRSGKAQREAREGAPPSNPAGERAESQMVRDGQESQEALRGGRQAQGRRESSSSP